MTIVALYANHDARMHAKSIELRASQIIFSANGSCTPRVSRATSFYRVCMPFQDDDGDDDEAKLLHLPSISDRFDAF